MDEEQQQGIYDESYSADFGQTWGWSTEEVEDYETNWNPGSVE